MWINKIKTFFNFFRLFTRGLIDTFLLGNKKLYYLFLPLYIFFHSPLILGIIFTIIHSYWHLTYTIFWLYLWFFCNFKKISDLRIVAFLTLEIAKIFKIIKTDTKEFISQNNGDQDSPSDY